MKKSNETQTTAAPSLTTLSRRAFGRRVLASVAAAVIFGSERNVVRAAEDDVWAPWSPNGSASTPKINVKIDVSEAPDALDWAKKARLILIDRYPKIVETLDGADGVAKIDPNFEIQLIFKPTDGVAFASGTAITVSSKWIEKSPNDFGLIVHEATHVAQNYRGGEGWAVEGIADYVRYYICEPSSKSRWKIDPKRSKYTDGYGITATFFDWAIREKDPDFLRKLHRALRSRKRVDEFFADEYRTTPDALWTEFISSLT